MRVKISHTVCNNDDLFSYELLFENHVILPHLKYFDVIAGIIWGSEIERFSHTF